MKTKLAKLIKGALIVAVFIVGYFLSLPPKTNYKQLDTFVVDPRIIQAGQQLGLSPSQLQTVHAQFGISGCPEATSLACYDGQYIYMYPRALDPKYGTLAEHVAYEYSHYVWDRLPNQPTYKPALMNLYQANLNKPYWNQIWGNLTTTEKAQVGTPGFYNEMFANACTQFADNHLPPTLFQECSSFLPNRSALPSYF